MLDLAEALKAEVPRRSVAPRAAPQRSFTMQRLRRLSVWASSAACALLIAALASRTPTGAERIALALNGGQFKQTDQPLPAFDAEAATERLGEAVRGLAANDAAIKTRLAAVEQDMTDVTGSVTKQIAAAQAATTTRHPDDGPTVMATATETTALAAPDAPPQAAAALLAAIQPPVGAALPTIPRAEFGVDIGSGLTVQALRTRWAAMSSAHPELFAGLEPVISVKEGPHSKVVELRLVAGPIAQPAAATQLCTTLTALGQFCQPTFFDGQHLTLR
jgi:hypothetical protein